MPTMKTLKALLLCLLLIPAAASASTIGFNDRYQTVTPASSTDELTLDFPITNTGDLTILVDGVETNDFTVTATFSDGIATGATVDINTPVVSNPTIEIIGTREPSRTQFTVSSGQNLVGKINAEIAQRTLEIQEVYRDLSRSLKFPYGDSVDPTLGDVDDRASKYLFFDSTGKPTFTGSTPSDAAEPFATKSAVEAATVSDSVNFIRTAGYASEGDGGAASYKRVGSEPDHDLKIQSADGAWWEIAESQAITFQAAGGVEGDDSGNGAGNVTAFDAFIAYLQEQDTDGNVSGPALLFPVMDGNADYHFNTHLNVKAAARIIGTGGWFRNRSNSPTLHFPADSHGIIFHRDDTIDDTTEASGYDAEGFVMEGLSVNGGGNDETTGHGVWLRAFGTVRHVYVSNFAENCFHIVGTIGSGTPADEGNVSLFKVENSSAEGCGGSGFYVRGADANAGQVIGSDSRNNGRWGFLDESFLGNTYVANHETNNGLATVAGNGAGESSKVEHSGNIYDAHRGATEAELVATTPGTDASVWIDQGSGSATSKIPAWQSSQPEGTYFTGGSYGSTNANARNVYIGNYAEGNSADPQMDEPATVIGGHRMDKVRTGAAYYGADAATALIKSANTMRMEVSNLEVIGGAIPHFFLEDGSGQQFEANIAAGGRVRMWATGGNKAFLFEGGDGVAVDDIEVRKSGGTEDIASSSGTTGGSGSAGAGSQYIELNIGGTVYKVLHDGTL